MHTLGLGNTFLGAAGSFLFGKPAPVEYLRGRLTLLELQGFSVSSCSSHGGGLHYGFRRTKVGAWMPRTVGVVLANKGVSHLTQGLLTLHNLKGDARKNVNQKKKEIQIRKVETESSSFQVSYYTPQKYLKYLHASANTNTVTRRVLLACCRQQSNSACFWRASRHW